MNRLSREKSPYLLQHAGNPVDWYPWGDEAFDRARREDKPVFLSIGYSTCHWCHVMERESFEDEEVASLLNRDFVCVKVDREERPDVDGVYMDAAVAMTGRGGWPLTIVMTADGGPFFAATYLPKESRFGMPGMLDLLPRLAELWRDGRTEVLRTAESVREFLTRTAAGSESRVAGTGKTTDRRPGEIGEGATAETDRRTGEIGEDTIAAAAHELASRFDREHGGFGGAPKFPSAHTLIFLLRRWRATRDERLLEMAVATLDAMRMGGIYDQVGFGFHRYSTDERWLVPHFEKMLYDQAMLSLAYAEAAVATEDRRHERTALEIIEYVLRDMRAPDGGFCSAEDADSEGVEGKFYLWTTNELSAVLGDDAALAGRIFGAADEGTADLEPLETGGARGTQEGPPDAPPGKGGRPAPGDRPNVLHLMRPPEEIASGLGMSEGALREKMESIRRRLMAARAERVRPGRDDKVLTDWNGLMISALAVAASRFGDSACADAATHAARFLLGAMRDRGGRLLHRFREGEAAIPAGADDYAFLVAGLLDLYDATLEPEWLEESLRLTGEFAKHFADPSGGFCSTADDAERLMFRKKEAHDGAIPSGNSVAMRNLIRLSRVTGDARLETAAADLSRAFSSDAAANPSAHASLLTSVQSALSPDRQVVVVGDAGSADTRRLLDTLRGTRDPELVVLLLDDRSRSALGRVAPWTEGLTPPGGRATAYVCHGRTCELPATDARQLALALRER
jgi:uncharacterized protein YyaL (SSP411 family)